MAPVERSGYSEDGLSATGIRFNAERGDFGSTAPRSAANGTAPASIAERLEAHGEVDRFGVKPIRNPLGIAEQEILLETCDSAPRPMHSGPRGP